MQIYDLLKKEHQNVKILLNSIEKNNDKDLLPELKKEVILHSQAEEEAFYDPLEAKAGKTKIMVKAAHSEHDLVSKMMSQLAKITNDDEWMRLFSVIKKSLESHIKMEEEDIFDLAKKHFSSKDAEEMASTMQQKKEVFAKKYKD